MLEVFFTECPQCKKCPIQFQWAFAAAARKADLKVVLQQRGPGSPLIPLLNHFKELKLLNVGLKMCNWSCQIWLLQHT